MQSYKTLLSNNKKWARKQLEIDSNFFEGLSKGQSPQYLWIGCSDSRVPANEITGTRPGEMFVHRNIANMVVHSDINMLSVLSYAVDVLNVKNIIVCGHYGCGGITAAMSHNQYGLIDNWLRNIKDVFRLHQVELNEITEPAQRERKLVELNVKEQVLNLGKTSIVQNAWRTRKDLNVHGWVYDVKDGILKDLDVTCSQVADLDTIYHFSH